MAKKSQKRVAAKARKIEDLPPRRCAKAVKGGEGWGKWEVNPGRILNRGAEG